MANSNVIKALAIAGAVSTLGFAAVPAAAQTVKIDGSSTVFPITEAVAEEFQKSKKGAVKVTVGISGTGGGFKKFCRGQTDISNASRPILKSEMDECAKAGIRYLEMPVAYDALTDVVNPKSPLASISIEDLKKMWEPAAQGKVTRWNQVNPAWPDAPVKLFGAGSDSGTFDYFTEAVTGKAKASRGDYTASEDDNVLVQGVSRDKGAIGYFGFAYFIENRESLAQAAIREAKEETGIDVELTHLVGLYSRTGTMYLGYTVLFAARPVGGAPKLQHGETIAVEWFPFDEIPAPPSVGQERRIRDAFHGAVGLVVHQEIRSPRLPAQITKEELYALRDRSGLPRQAFYLKMFGDAEIKEVVELGRHHKRIQNKGKRICLRSPSMLS